MPSLISVDQLIQIKNALQDVTDTFLQKDFIYNKYGHSTDRFQEDGQQKSLQPILMKGLFKFKDKSNVASNNWGEYDNSDAYILLKISDIEPLGIVDIHGNFTGVPNTDSVIYQNEEYSVEGAVPIGQLIDENVLFKVFISKNIKNG